MPLPPPDGTVSSPAWSADGRTVYAAVGLRGFIDLWAFPVEPATAGSAVPLTRTQGAALAPAPRFRPTHAVAARSGGRQGPQAVAPVPDSRGGGAHPAASYPATSLHVPEVLKKAGLP